MGDTTTTSAPGEEHVATRDLLASARELRPLVDERASAEDEASELAPDVVQALHETGLFGMWIPRSLGGTELDPLRSIEVIEQLSYGDASTGWAFMANALCTGTGAGYLGDEAADELFAEGRRTIIAGQGTRPGTAIPENGGFRLSGSWSFASGIRNATHTHSLAVIEPTGEPRIFVAPIEEATLLGNWDVMGLRATASLDYTMDSVFVPDAYSHFATADTPKRGGTLYYLGIIGFVCIGHSGWTLGVGRRLLDELAALAQSKAGRPGAAADRDSFQEDYARAEATYRAARALVFETWNDVWETLERGDELSTRQRTLMRLSLTNLTWSVQEVGMFVYTAAGTTALRAGTIQRFFRDLHAGTQHVTSAPPVIQTCGRELAGLAEGKTWVFLELVDPH
jgi:alkylation response protein AidB-like acyl-CoA dehydrogenase